MTGSGFGQPVAWNVDTYVSSETENSKFTIVVAFLCLSLYYAIFIVDQNLFNLYSNRFSLLFLENHHAFEPLVLIFASNIFFPYLSAKFAKLFP